MTPVGGEEPRPRRSTRFVFVTLTGVLAAVVTFATLAVVVVAVTAVHLGDGLSHIGERKHLKPIPISTTACPYVALMHAAANDFQAHEPMLGLMVDANGQVLPIAKERTIVGPPLARFEWAIALSRPHFPAAVRTQLAVTQRAVHQGRAQLARATDPYALGSNTVGLLSTGQQAFGYASDLVGTQCGHGLGADSNAGPYFGPGATITTTTTASRS